MRRIASSIAALLAIVVVLGCGSYAKARKLVTPDNVDEMDQKFRVETLTIMYDDLVTWNIFIQGAPDTVKQSPVAGLSLRDSRGEISYEPLELAVVEGEWHYFFEVKRDHLEHSKFYYLDYEVGLRDWVSPDGPIQVNLEAPQEIVASGDTIYATIRLTGIDKSVLLFGSNCQDRYEIFDAGGNSVALLMDACGQVMTEIRLEPGETRDLPVRIFTTGLEPGEYSVECFVRGYRDKGLTKSFKLVVGNK